jgi:hypothetical protein
MKITDTHFAHQSTRPIGIQNAVERACDGGGHGVGQLEEAVDTARNAASFLGSLLEALHDKGVFSDAEVLDLLGQYRFKRVED